MKERPIKGGYILISLGLIALSTSYSGSIDYERISKTKKHIVLTGIKVGSEVKPDITVKPIYGSGTITFEDVYGFDIVISSNNSVSVSEHVAPSSGTKLYKHVIDMNSGNKAVVISTIGNPFVGTEEISKGASSTSLFNAISIVVYDSDNDKYIDCYTLFLNTGGYMGNNIDEVLYESQFVSDTVTEL